MKVVYGEQAPQTSDHVYSYDASARRLISAVYTYGLDEALRTYKVYETGTAARSQSCTGPGYGPRFRTDRF